MPIKHQWVACFKDAALNLGENTNNRLESTFSKIKSVCSKYASLLQFFHEFFSVLRTLRNERNHHYLMALARKPVENQHCDPNVQQYAQHLTPYAFQFVRTQMDLSNAIKTENVTRKPGQTFEIKSSGDLITATSFSCTCSSAKRMGLPCRHILKVRGIMNLPLFEPTLVNQRWTMAYYEDLAETRFSCDDSTHLDQPHTTVAVAENKQTVLSQAQKFRKALRIAQSLASLASEGGMRTFTKRLRQLEDVAEYWSLGREITISAPRESHPSAGKQDPGDKESGRQVREKRSEDKMEEKEQKQKNARERQGRETHGKSEVKKIKNGSGGNKEKFKTGEGEHEKWNTDESQEQEQHGKITISARRESRPSHERHDPPEKETGRKIKRKKNEDETTGKEQKQKNASERKGQETNDGQSVEKKAKTEAKGQEKNAETCKETQSKKLAQNISRERQAESEGKKIKNDSGGNEEKLSKDGGEHEKWNRGERQQQEENEKMKDGGNQAKYLIIDYI